MDTRTERFVLFCFHLSWLVAEYNDKVFAHNKELDAENAASQAEHDLNPEVVLELFICFFITFLFALFDVRLVVLRLSPLQTGSQSGGLITRQLSMAWAAYASVTSSEWRPSMV